MARRTLESILQKIWYRSHGLHLISTPDDAPVRVKNDSVALGPALLVTRLIILYKVDHSTTSPRLRKIEIYQTHVHLPSTWGLLMRFATMGT
jgi:hypothetical protein